MAQIAVDRRLNQGIVVNDDVEATVATRRPDVRETIADRKGWRADRALEPAREQGRIQARFPEKHRHRLGHVADDNLAGRMKPLPEGLAIRHPITEISTTEIGEEQVMRARGFLSGPFSSAKVFLPGVAETLRRFRGGQTGPGVQWMRRF